MEINGVTFVKGQLQHLSLLFKLVLYFANSGLGEEGGRTVGCGNCDCGKRNAQKGKKEFHKIRDSNDMNW